MIFDLKGPLRADSLKDKFVQHITKYILSGQLKPGARLPSERSLAQDLNISRLIVNKGLQELSHHGIVTIIPRSGVYVNDFRESGSMSILTSLISHMGMKMDFDLVKGFLDTRCLIEKESARLAAANRSEKQLDAIFSILEEEFVLIKNGKMEIDAELYFSFHHSISIASGNVFFSLIVNSLKPLYLHLIDKTKEIQHQHNYMIVYNHHERIASAIKEKDELLAAEEMNKFLTKGIDVVLMKLSDKNLINSTPVVN